MDRIKEVYTGKESNKFGWLKGQELRHGGPLCSKQTENEFRKPDTDAQERTSFDQLILT